VGKCQVGGYGGRSATTLSIVLVVRDAFTPTLLKAEMMGIWHEQVPFTMERNTAKDASMAESVGQDIYTRGHILLDRSKLRLR
jgi:hypothetical protein